MELFITYSLQADMFSLSPFQKPGGSYSMNSCQIREDVTVSFLEHSFGALEEIVILGIHEPRDDEWFTFVRRLLGKTVWQMYRKLIAANEGIKKMTVNICSDEAEALSEVWADCHRQVREQLRL